MRAGGWVGVWWWGLGVGLWGNAPFGFLTKKLIVGYACIDTFRDGGWGAFWCLPFGQQDVQYTHLARGTLKRISSSLLGAMNPVPGIFQTVYQPQVPTLTTGTPFSTVASHMRLTGNNVQALNGCVFRCGGHMAWVNACVLPPTRKQDGGSAAFPDFFCC